MASIPLRMKSNVLPTAHEATSGQLPPHWHDSLPQGLCAYCSLGLERLPLEAKHSPATSSKLLQDLCSSLSFSEAIHVRRATRSHPCAPCPHACLGFIPPWHLSPTGTPCLFVHCLPLHSRPNAAPSGWELSVLFTVIAPNVVGRCSKNILECKHACVRDQLCNLKSIWGHPKLRLSHTDQSE